MIDIKFLRENPEIVKENIRKKFQDVKLPLVDEVIEYDEKSRSAQRSASCREKETLQTDRCPDGQGQEGSFSDGRGGRSKGQSQ